MKKLLIGSLLTLTVSYFLVSCSGKAYDADPNTDYSAAKIPDSTTGVVLISSMQGTLNGAKVVFAPAYYNVITDPDGNFPPYRSIYAGIRNDTVYYRSFTMTCLDSIVKNKTDYALTSAVVTFNIYDTVLKKQKVYQQKPGGNTLSITIIEDKDKGMRGVLNGTLPNVLPEPGNPNDVVTFKDMYFYFDERKK